MLGSLTTAAVSHRILASRIFVLAFLLAALLTGSALKESLWPASLFVVGVVLIGIAIAGRLWCSLYISGYKGAELITSGPYSICRNPLYFFSFLGFVGVGLVTETLTLGIAMAVAFLFGYRVVIAREEHELTARFGAAYLAYCARTPRFLPDLSKFDEPATHVVNPALFRRTMGDVVWFVWMVGIIEFVEALHELGIVNPLLTLP